MSAQDEDMDAKLMTRLEEMARDKPEMQKQLAHIKEVRTRQRQAEVRWITRFDAFFTRHPPLSIPTRRDLSTNLEQAQFEAALGWAQQELKSLKWLGNTVLTGDRPSAAAMQQVLEQVPSHSPGTRLLLRPDWTRFQDWYQAEYPGNPGVCEPEGYTHWWHLFEYIERMSLGSGHLDSLSATVLQRLASASPHIYFLKQDHGCWSGSLSAHGQWALWQFDGQKLEFVDDLMFWIS